MSGNNTITITTAITAVTGYSVARNTTWTLEIVYHIHAMLLYNNNNNNDSNTNNPHPHPPTPPQQQQRCVEQWSLQLTAGQFHAVASELFRQCHEIHMTNDVAIGNDVKNTDDHILQRLPTWSCRPTIVEVDQSLSIVDSILRSWILPPLCVNTRALKQFVGLQNNNDNKVNNNSNYKRTSVSIGMASFRSLFRHATCSLYQSIGDSQSYHDNRSESYHIRCL